MKTLAWAFGLAMLFAPAAVAQTHDELVKGATDTNNVLNYGMGYNLQRFSALKQINRDTVKRLVPVWNYSFDDNRSKESQAWSIRASSAGDAAHRLLRNHQPRRRHL
jgi:alcohol dehydrogenase (cytochrome c)